MLKNIVDTYKVAVSEKRLIKSGFETMRELSISPNAPQIQLDDMEFAFMSGANHLWRSIMLLTDDNTPDEVSDQEMSYMDDIQEELKEWAEALKNKK